MMGRAFGISAAIGVTLIGVAIPIGAITYDFFGGDVFVKAWENVHEASRPRVEQSELKRARDFTFFNNEPVKGQSFEVTSGVRFATLADLQAGRQQDRWCYVMLRPQGGGSNRQINLGRQDGMSLPVFDNLSAYPEAELRDLGVSVTLLASIARSHCRFFPTDGRTVTASDDAAEAGRRI